MSAEDDSFSSSVDRVPHADSVDYSKNFSTVDALEAFPETHPHNATRDVSGDILDDGLRRGLKGRHFMIIALGSIIGPGTFYGLGYAIYLSGPLGALLGFIIVGPSRPVFGWLFTLEPHSNNRPASGISVWILMQEIGEMTTLFPIHGGFVEV